MKRKTKDLIRASIRQRSKLTDEVGEHPRKAKRKKRKERSSTGKRPEQQTLRENWTRFELSQSLF